MVARGASDAAAAAAAKPLVTAGHEHLACIKRGKEWLVVDGAVAVTGQRDGLLMPCLHYANDPRGTELTPACTMSKGGVMRARRAVPALDLARPLADQLKSELTWSYGARFWAVHS